MNDNFGSIHEARSILEAYRGHVEEMGGGAVEDGSRPGMRA